MRRLLLILLFVTPICISCGLGDAYNDGGGDNYGTIPADLRSPSNLSFNYQNETLTIDWKDESSDETGYIIYRQKTDGSVIGLDTVSKSNLNSYQIKNYRYLYNTFQIRAFYFDSLNYDMHEGNAGTISVNLGPTSVSHTTTSLVDNVDSLAQQLNFSWSSYPELIDSCRITWQSLDGDSTTQDVNPQTSNFSATATHSGLYVFSILSKNKISSSPVLKDTVFISGWTQPVSVPEKNIQSLTTLTSGNVIGWIPYKNASSPSKSGYVVYNTKTNQFSDHADALNATGKYVGSIVPLPNNEALIRIDGASSAALLDLNHNMAKYLDTGVTAGLGTTEAPLPDGRILVVGATATKLDSMNDKAVDESYEPEKESFVKLNSPLLTLTLPLIHVLPDGKVLIAGGYIDVNYPTDEAWLFDPKSNSFQKLPSMPVPMVHPVAVQLDDQKTLVGVDNHLFVFNEKNEDWQKFPMPRHRLIKLYKLKRGEIMAITGDDTKQPGYTEFYYPRLKKWIYGDQINSKSVLGGNFRSAFQLLPYRPFLLSTQLQDGRIFLMGNNGYATIWR